MIPPLAQCAEMSHTTPTGDHPKSLRLLLETLSFCQYLVRRYIDDGCLQSAAALTFLMLMALVPLMTVGFALFTAIPAFESFGDTVQSFVFEHFVPSSGSEVQQYLDSFSQQARNLTAISLGLLAISAYSTLRNIEKTFNRIWRTRENRKGLNTLLLYWAILTLGPVLLGAGLLMTTYLSVMVREVDVLGVMPYVLQFLPWVLTSVTFTLLFFAIPNCKVPLRDATIGGFVFGALFELSKFLFASIVSNASYQQIYGTFATFPLFLIWVYFSWVLVLAGAVFVRAVSSYYSRFAPESPDLIVAVQALKHFWDAQQKGNSVEERFFFEEDWLLDGSVNREQWESLRNSLLHKGIIAVTESEQLVLTCDLHRLSLWDLQLMLNSKLRRLYNAHNGSTIHARFEQDNAWFAALKETLRVQRQQHNRQFDLSIADLFMRDETAATDTQIKAAQ